MTLSGYAMLAVSMKAILQTIINSLHPSSSRHRTNQTSWIDLISTSDINHHIDETLVGLLLQLRHRRTADINFKRRRSSIQVFLFLIRICECLCATF